MLGSAHIWGTTQNAFNIGAISVWFGIACTVMMVVICMITGPAIRKIGTPTVPDLFGKLFGEKTRMIVPYLLMTFMRVSTTRKRMKRPRQDK